MSIFRHKPGEILVDKLDIDRPEPGPFIFDPEKEIGEEEWAEIDAIIEKNAIDLGGNALVCIAYLLLLQKKIFTMKKEERKLEIQPAVKRLEELKEEINLYDDILHDSEPLNSACSSLMGQACAIKIIQSDTTPDILAEKKEILEEWLEREISDLDWRDEHEDLTIEFVVWSLIVHNGNLADVVQTVAIESLWKKAPEIIENLKNREGEEEEYARALAWLKILSPQRLEKVIKIDNAILGKAREKALKTRGELKEEVWRTNGLLETLLALTILSAEKVWVDETGLHYELPKNRPTVAPIPPLPEPLKF